MTPTLGSFPSVGRAVGGAARGAGALTILIDGMCRAGVGRTGGVQLIAVVTAICGVAGKSAYCSLGSGTPVSLISTPASLAVKWPS